MSDVFNQMTSGPHLSALEAVVRLLGAFALGWIVAQIYQWTRPAHKANGSFKATLVLLAILIAIVTDVVGGNAARAFSLVGALSIVRFRTVVQDTQDTAFVIFAVVMGMAAGAADFWMSVLGTVVVGGAAFLMRPNVAAATPGLDYTLQIRVGLGHDVNTLIGGPFGAYVEQYRLKSMETAKQGTAVDASYALAFKSESSPEALIKALNRTEGVQNVHLQDIENDDD
jgi:hypothetical protein